jgi:murein DD-endopeptidase MepM/ murein hydrolase activator NlpD
MKRLVILAISAATAAGTLFGWTRLSHEPPAPPTEARRTSDVELVPDSNLITGVIPSRTTLGGMLQEYAVLDSERHALVSAVRSVFDVRRVREGQPFVVDRLLDGRVRTFEYEIDGDRRLVVRALEGEEGGVDLDAEFAALPDRAFEAVIEPIEKTVEVTAVEGEINRDAPSLTEALGVAGERIDLALQMAEIFGGELDFSSELQPGDNFRLVVERYSRDGALAGYGAVLAAEFVASGRSIQAYRYTAVSGEPDYYDQDGRSLKRFFLKTPLKFEPRITSSFSRGRRHPILNYTRAHNGVDYAANTGAPVAAVAPGTVTRAGWTGGGGRTVRIRHSNGYESEYLHLSAISVRAGQRIGQGELVGKVGATGLATGPHLHYGLKKNGSYVNPVVEHRNMPPGEPVPALERASFAFERARLYALFDTVRPRNAN